MSIHEISNPSLRISVSEKGAELQSIFNINTGLEYVWDADPAYWSKKSPVLFPIVGGLKQNTFYYDQKAYALNRHGFARESQFSVIEKTEDRICFSLISNETTLQFFPFHFDFRITYQLDANKLHVSYTVKNTDQHVLFFSVGAHPAFKVPLVEGTSFSDYYLKFSTVENADKWPLSADGLIEKISIPLLKDTQELPLTKELFYTDALVFKDLASTSISILSHNTSHGITVLFNGFPYMGIWNAKDADFVCIEPWCGIADSVDSTMLLSEKEGINQLEPNAIFSRTWTVETF